MVLLFIVLLLVVLVVKVILEVLSTLISLQHISTSPSIPPTHARPHLCSLLIYPPSTTRRKSFCFPRRMRLGFTLSVNLYVMRPTAPRFFLFSGGKCASHQPPGPSQTRQTNAMKLPCMCTLQCGSMEAKALNLVLHTAGSKHHQYSQPGACLHM